MTVAKATIKVEPEKLELDIGESKKITATVKGSKKKITWTTSDKSVATVKDGKVKAKKAGSAVITAKANGASAKVKVTVKEPTGYTKAYADWLGKYPARFSEKYNNASYNPSDKSFVNSFLLYDFDKNKIPELITFTNVNFCRQIIRIYTYEKGKVKAVKFTNGGNAEFDNQAGVAGSIVDGAYTFKICKKGHIHNQYSGDMMNQTSVYMSSRHKIKEYLLYTQPSSWFEALLPEARKYGKKISIKEYERLVAKCSYLNLKTYNNIVSERDKLIKGKCKIN